MQQIRKPSCGLLLLGCAGFRDWDIGARSASGDYRARIETKASGVIQRLSTVVDVKCPGVVYSDETARSREVILDFLRQDVDCVAVCFLSWMPDALWTRIIRDMPKIPLIYFMYGEEHVKWDDSLSEGDFAEFLVSSDLVGALEGSGSLKRSGKNATVISGSPSDPRTLERIRDFGYAAMAHHQLQNARIGLLGSLNESMRVTWIDPCDFFFAVGPEITFLSIAELQRAIQKISDGEAVDYRDRLRAAHQVDPDVQEQGFLEAARLSLGMAGLMDEHGLDALSCHEFNRDVPLLVKIVPGIFPERISKAGKVITPEGDVGMAALMLAMRIMSDNAIINFVEPHYLDLEHNRILACHGGPNDHFHPQGAQYTRIQVDFRNSQELKSAPGAPITWIRIPPGAKTLVHFSGCNGAYRMVTAIANSLSGKHSVSGYTHTVFEFESRVEQLMERVAAIGTTQHFAVVEGDLRPRIETLCRIMGFEYHAL